MATVFLAHDLRHHRQVAIKVLHPELTTSIGTERFLREIRTAAQIVHPHILPVFDSGDADGLLYYTMPYAGGESLAHRLAREGSLPIEEAVRIARQVAEALAYAHERGIVHRDIKPGNILLPDHQHVAVADFGLARAISVASRQQLTATGMVVGSPLYMAPEQIEGNADVDGRADVYGLACVLFEMLTGRPPFEGSTIQSILTRHLTKEPPAVRSLRAEVPSPLEDVVARALVKPVGERLRGAAELAGILGQIASAREARGSVRGSSRPLRGLRGFLAAWRFPLLAASFSVFGVAVATGSLGWWELPGSRRSSTVAPELDPSRIAVLYFDDHSADGDLEYLATGLTERLIHELSQVEALDIVSRNGVKPFRGRDVPMDSIIRTLRVGTIVEGSVQSSGDRIRLVVQLIDASTGTHLQSRSLERPTTEVFLLEDDLAVEVAGFLRRRLGQEIRLRTQGVGTRSTAARDLLLRAGQLRDDAAQLAGEPDLLDASGAIRLIRAADSLLVRAERLDPAWTAPTLVRGWLAADRARLRGSDKIGWLRRAIAHAERALSLRPALPEALELRGTAQWRIFIIRPDTSTAERLLAEAESDLRAALAENPASAGGWSTLSEFLRYRGAFAEAYLAAQRALKEDAYLSDADEVMERLSEISLSLGRYEDANTWCNRGRRAFPNDWRFRECLLTVLSQDSSETPDPVAAWRLVDELDRLDPPARARATGRTYQPLYRRMLAAAVLARAGQKDSALAVVARARAAAGNDDDVLRSLSYDEAYIQLLIGDRGTSLRLLRAYLTAVPHLKPYVARDRLFRPLRDDPRFQAMVTAP